MLAMRTRGYLGPTERVIHNIKKQDSLSKKNPEKELSKIPWVILEQKLVQGKSHEILTFNNILKLF